jgi:hypothetical protein
MTSTVIRRRAAIARNDIGAVRPDPRFIYASSFVAARASASACGGFPVDRVSEVKFMIDPTTGEG